MSPPCTICRELASAEMHPAKLFTCMTMNYGGTKIQKWLAVCEAHYTGGPVLLLTEVPELFLKKEATR